MPAIEKREYPRREASFFTVARQLGENGEARLPQAGYARDISSGGLFFYTENSVEQGERVLLAIYPDSDLKHGRTSPKLVAQGNVLRVGPASASHLPGEMQGVAVKFDRQPEIVLEDHDIASLMLLTRRLPARSYFSHSARRTFAKTSASAK